jgi:hypothetical protein
MDVMPGCDRGPCNLKGSWVGVMIGLFGAIAAAQEPMPAVGTPYVCQDGLTWVVQACERRGRHEICTFRKERDGVVVENSYGPRASLATLMKDCRPRAKDPSRSLALHPAYLAEFPAPARIMAEFTGASPADTAARQMGAFWQLRAILEDLAWGLEGRYRNRLSADEQRLVAEYRAAYAGLQQAHPHQPGRRAYEHDEGVRDQLWALVLPPSVRALHRQARAASAARTDTIARADQDALAQRREEQQQALAAQQPRDWERRSARCLAAGRSPVRCTGDRLGEGLGELVGALTPSASQPLPRGLRLSGAYPGGGDFDVLMFGPTSAVLRCRGAIDRYDYTILRDGSRLAVSLQQLSGPVLTLSARADGSLDGAGQMIRITQRVRRPLGETAERRVDGGLNVTEHTAVGSRTEECRVGIVGPATEAELGFLGPMADEFGAEAKAGGLVARPGLRFGGEFGSGEGLMVEFHPDAAVLDCGGTVVARPYTVTLAETRAVVTIDNASTPLVLTELPNGALTGDGPVAVAGRSVSFTPAREPVFTPRTVQCRVGTLAPTGGVRSPEPHDRE